MSHKILNYTFIILFVCITNTYAKYTDILDSSDLKCVKTIADFIDRNKYTDALLTSDNCDDEAIKLLTQWLIIQNADYFSLGSLSNYKKNIVAIPLPDKLQQRFMNAAHEEGVDRTEFTEFFAENNITDFDLLRKYLKMNENNGLITGSYKEQLIIKVWIEGNHAFDDLKAFLQLHKDLLTKELIIAKANQYLMKGDDKTANFLGSYVLDQDYKKYLKITTSFENRSNAAISLLSSIPDEYKNDEILLYYIAKYYNSLDQDSKVTKYVLALDGPLEYPDKWHDIRVRNARYHIEQGNYQTAYKILTNHQMKPGSAAYAEIEWLAGWVALRFLDAPLKALDHFQNMYDNVGYTISLSRGAYWLARSYKALGNASKANYWFQIASSYSTTYYGQMALMENTKDLKISLPKLKKYEPSELKFRVNSDIALRLCLYLQYMGQEQSAYQYAKYIIENTSNNNSLFLYLAVFKQTEDYAFITKISRYATRKNVITTANYPIIEDMEINNRSLVFAIIKQESGFNDQAISNKGAIGFMQLMPATAQDVSRRLKLKYSYSKLRNNQEYNITLGSYYIEHLLKKYDNSYILAVAAYNAGPSNVNKWLKRNGDVREYSNIYDIIDWVEKISFPETRNYVQRILENMIIYMHILDDENA